LTAQPLCGETGIPVHAQSANVAATGTGVINISRCILHIGWHKTGTTALQAFLGAQAPALAQAGFRYPAFRDNHSDCLVSVAVDATVPTYAEHFSPATKGYEGEDRKAAAHRIMADLMAQTDALNLVLSGEDLCLLEPPEVQRLHHEVSAVYDDVVVVAYVRNHVDYARSALQQLLRMGFQAEEVMAQAQSAGPFRVLGPLPDYARRIDIWRDVFGAHCLRLFDYDAVAASGQSIQQHFCETCLQPGLYAGLTQGQSETPRVNQAFSQAAGYMLHRMNRMRPLLLEGRPNPGFVFNRQHWLAGVRGAPLALPAEMAGPIATAVVADAGLFEVLGKAPGTARQNVDYTQTVAQMFTGNDLLDDLAITLDSTIAAATGNLAREKFFAFLPRLQRAKLRADAVTQMHLALFLLADRPRIVSCGLALLNAGEIDLARPYAAKALAFGPPAANLTDLLNRIAATDQAKMSGSP
jgi:hypothetical protein